MYTIEVLENLGVQLDEIIYLMEDICNDSRVKLKRKESLVMADIKDTLYNAKNIAMASLKSRYRNQ